MRMIKHRVIAMTLACALVPVLGYAAGASAPAGDGPACTGYGPQTPRDIDNHLQILKDIIDYSYYEIWYDTPQATTKKSGFWKMLFSRLWFYVLILVVVAIPIFKVFRSKITTGKEGIVGETGEARGTISQTEGVAFVHGER